MNLFVMLGYIVAVNWFCLTVVWLVSVKIKDASIIDIYWGIGFIVMAWASLAIGRAREKEIANLELGSEDVQERITVSALSNPQKIRAESLKRFQLFMGLTVLLSLVFLVAKAYEYNYKFSHGIYPKTHNFYAIYFTLTGLHALHIIGGVLVNGYFLLPWKSLLLSLIHI